MGNRLSFRSEQMVVQASGYISRTSLCPSVVVIREAGGPQGPGWTRVPDHAGRQRWESGWA